VSFTLHQKLLLYDFVVADKNVLKKATFWAETCKKYPLW
jgi:hypothetical protein